MLVREGAVGEKIDENEHREARAVLPRPFLLDWDRKMHQQVLSSRQFAFLSWLWSHTSSGVSVDFWTILLAAWLPVAGIVLALCLYAKTDSDSEVAGARTARRDSDPRAETPSSD